jgi:glycosyltransferase involved in cell wall biosynthesis
MNNSAAENTSNKIVSDNSVPLKHGSSNQRSTKVVFFCRFPPPFTGETLCSQQSYELVKDTFEVTKIQTLAAPRETRQGGKFDLGELSSSLQKALKLRSDLRRNKADTLYFVPGASLLGHLRDLLTLWLLRPFVGRVVAHVHSGNLVNTLNKPVLRVLSRWFIGRIDSFIFLTAQLSQTAEGVIPSSKRCVIHNPIDEGVAFTPFQASEKIARRARRDVFNILFLSNLYATKGYWELARALENLPGQWHAHFVGAFPDSEAGQEVAFRGFLETSGFKERVTLHGSIKDRAVIRELLSDADVFVLPSYFPMEAQPRSIIEAMNASTPIISTRHASIPEYVFDDVNGYLVEQRSSQAVAAALQKLMDADNWQRKAKAARETFETMFDSNVIRQQLIQVLQGEA